jgi:hypothetical protein
MGSNPIVLASFSLRSNSRARPESHSLTASPFARGTPVVLVLPGSGGVRRDSHRARFARFRWCSKGLRSCSFCSVPVVFEGTPVVLVLLGSGGVRRDSGRALELTGGGDCVVPRPPQPIARRGWRRLAVLGVAARRCSSLARCRRGGGSRAFAPPRQRAPRWLLGVGGVLESRRGGAAGWSGGGDPSGFGVGVRRRWYGRVLRGRRGRCGARVR